VNFAHDTYPASAGKSGCSKRGRKSARRVARQFERANAPEMFRWNAHRGLHGRFVKPTHFGRHAVRLSELSDFAGHAWAMPEPRPGHGSATVWPGAGQRRGSCPEAARRPVPVMARCGRRASVMPATRLLRCMGKSVAPCRRPFTRRGDGQSSLAGCRHRSLVPGLVTERTGERSRAGHTLAVRPFVAACEAVGWRSSVKTCF